MPSQYSFSTHQIIPLSASSDKERSVTIDFFAELYVGAWHGVRSTFFSQICEPCVGDAVAVVVVGGVVAVGGADDTSAYLHGVKVG